MNKTFQISQKDLKLVNAKGSLSVENRKAYDAENSKLEYIGSQIMDSGRVYDYHIDEQGRYWYKTRMRLPNGQIVSMEQHLFGTENLKRKRHRQ